MNLGKPEKLLIIVLSGVLIALLIFAAFVAYYLVDSGGESEETKGIKIGPVIETEEFTVNLNQSLSHFIKAKFALEVDGGKAISELEEKSALLKDTIILVLSKQTLETLSSAEGKENLKQTLIARINEFMEKGKVTRVYFLNFIYT